jgi:hypothetical protein
MELLTDTEESEIARTRWENGSRPSRSALQRRFDTFTSRLCALRQENQDLRRENSELRDGLARSLRLVDKLRDRKKCQTNNSR